MKKYGILNSDISRILSYLRHTDTICIGDCGLPCPDGTELIDISIELGKPSFLEVLKVVLSDMKIEKITMAQEIKEKNQNVLNGIRELTGNVEEEFIAHEDLKKELKNCKAVIRTGETTPFANILLQSACIF